MNCLSRESASKTLDVCSVEEWLRFEINNLKEKIKEVEQLSAISKSISPTIEIERGED